MTTDEQLLREARAGEEEAFAELYRRHRAGLYRYALQMMGSVSAAEDAVQEAFLSLVRSSNGFDPNRGPLRAYLFGSVRRLVWRLAEVEREFEEPPADIPADGDDLLDGLSREERLRTVREAIAALPTVYREAVVLCDLEELPYEEAARALGVPVGTVRSRLSRGRQVLAGKLRAKFVGGRL